MAFDIRDQRAVDDLRDAQENGNVIGLAAVTGDVVSRLDIDDLLLNEKDCFNLFLLALQALQAHDQRSKTMSYYQIAGIHGMPGMEWNNVDVELKTDAAKKKGYYGYCAHSANTFPTWHRSYLALIEQTIYSKMIELVKVWDPESERADQLKAAKKFRLPYWDYWKPRGGPVTFPGVVTDGKQTNFAYDFRIPDIFVAKKVMVRQPEKRNQLDAIDNPLVSFTFPEKGSSELWGDVWKPVTSRYPIEDKPVTSMNHELNMAREGNNTLFNTMVQDLAYKYYNDFSTNASNAFGGGEVGSFHPSGSLENIHNSYHWLIGGSEGTMNDPDIAAFDPVFWIHHCQIDRLLAIWQATHPNSWFDGEDGLVPFTIRKDEFWTSDRVRKTDVFGYTYSDSIGQTPDSIRECYGKKYGWQSQERGHPPSCMEPVPVFEKAQVFQYDDKTKDDLIAESIKTGALGAVLKNISENQVAQIAARQPVFVQQTVLSKSMGSETPIVEDRVLPKLVPSKLVIANTQDIKEEAVERTWYVDNIVERLALNGTFTIFFFIGAPSDNEAAKYSVQPTLAGITHNFAAPVEYCDNCGRQEEQGHLVTGTVVITPILEDYILANKLPNLKPESVKPFLVKNLSWRIVTHDGERVDPRYVRGLKLGITSKVTGPEGGQVRYQEYNDVIAEILRNSS